MAGTDPHALLLLLIGACTLTSLLASLGTWNSSRAKKVRLLEDQVVSAVRAQRQRADQIETKLAEWQATITGMLAEVEEFFERSVKERKRSQMAANRAAENLNVPPAMESLTRADQINVVRGAFADHR